MSQHQCITHKQPLEEAEVFSYVCTYTDYLETLEISEGKFSGKLYFRILEGSVV